MSNVQQDARKCTIRTCANDAQDQLMLKLQVSCGARHSVVLTNDCRALGCGCNKHGELGLGDNKVPKFVELPVPALATNPCHKVTDVEAGWWHTVILVQTRF